MLKSILGAVGIGGAKIDCVLNQGEVHPGQSMSGELRLYGGQVAQVIDGVALRLMTRMDVESDEGTYSTDHCLDQWLIHQQIQLARQQTQVIPFTCEIHPETPITVFPQHPQIINHCRVWIDTRLEIDWALDATDVDGLAVHPTPIVALVLEACDQLGLVLQSADVEQGYLQGPGFRSQSGCYQELEYRVAGYHNWSIDEVELSFVLETDCTHVLIEIDRRWRGDSYQSISIDHRTAHKAMVIEQLQHVLGI
jgi:sporulation-control protein